MRNMATTTQIDPPGLSPKKTLFVMVTVVGCIAILWPKVFYPMMFGGPIKQNPIKEHRGGTEKSYKSACCEVILDKDAFLNESLAVGERTYRKHINLYTGEISLRQERPPHLRPDTIHPAMRERGRAIPSTPTIPIVERTRTPSSPPRVVEGRPGPIPGMRPPLGAGSVHQAPQKTSSMGFIMPLYTIGIVAFFIYTIMKILFKKPVLNAPYGPPRSDPSFHKEVFGHDKSCCSGTKLDASNNTNNGYCTTTTTTTTTTNATATISTIPSLSSSSSSLSSSYQHGQCNSTKNRERDQLMEIEKLRKKLEETERAMAQLIAEMNCDRHKAKDTSENNCQQNSNNVLNGHANSVHNNSNNNDDLSNKNVNNDNEFGKHQQQHEENNDNNIIMDDNKIHHLTTLSSLTSSSSSSALPTSSSSLPSDIKNNKFNDDKNNSEYHLNYQNNNNNNSNENINDDNENVNNNENNKKLDNDNDNVKTINTSDIATGGVTTFLQHQQQQQQQNNKFERKKLDDNLERSVVVLGMELTASCEGGRKWNRPPTPIFIHPVEHSTTVDEDIPDPQPIYLEGALPHESKILVADSKTEKENIVDEEFNGSVDEPAVVLSSKMTLSLISLDADSSDENHKEDTNEDKDSPLDNDMEIINGEEQEDIKQPLKSNNDNNEQK